ncbi:MAG: O-antigen ligase family protein [Thermodesulfovibrionales bacterium]|jgi:O-antigen ligase
MKKRIYTIPLVCLLSYTVLTYFPLIYKYLPILGQLKIVLVSGILLLVSYSTSRAQYTNTTAFKNSIVFSWMWFLCIMCLGLLVSTDRGQTLNIIILNVKFLIVFLVMIKIVDSEERLNIVLKAFVACGIGMAFSTVFNYLMGNSEYLLGGYRGLAIESGIFADPNDLGLFLNATLPFTLYFLMKSKKKLFPLFGVLTIVTAIMFTFSRGGFLGLCVTGVGFYLFFAKKQKKYIFLLLIIAILFWSFAPQSYKERIATITDVKADANTGLTGTRIDAWRIVTSQAGNDWLLGVGAGNSLYIAGRAMNDWHSLHNTFLEVFVEMGIAALFLYIGFFVIPFKQYKSLLRSNDKGASTVDTVLFKTLLISLMSYGVTAFFLPQAYSAIIYTLTGIAVIEAELTKKKLAAATD